MKSDAFFTVVYQMLMPAEKRKGVFLIFLLFINSLLDFFSLAFFLPILLLLINPEYLGQNSALYAVHDFLGTTSTTSFSITLTVFVFLFIALKTKINLWVTHQKAVYAYSIGTAMTSRAVARYLQLPYTQFTHTDASTELNAIANIPLNFANNIIIPAGSLFSEGLVFILLLTGLAVYNIQVILFLLAILIPAFLVYWVRREKIKAISSLVRQSYPKLLKHVLRVVEGFVDIRAFGKEHFFKNRVDKASSRLGKIFARDHTARTGTARITEIIAAWCICMMIVYVLMSDYNRQEMLVLLGMYAGVSFRIIPSVNRMFAALHQIKVHEYTIHELGQIAPRNDEIQKEKAPIVFSSKIEIRGLGFGYPGHSQVLKNIDLVIRKGEKIALVGRSGSGKTTLLHLLLRFLKENQGEIIIDKTKLKEDQWPGWQKLIAYVPQSPYILNGSLMENIAFGVETNQVDADKVDQLLKELNLFDWVNSLPDGRNTMIGEKGIKISGGQRQRISIARALYHNAELLLFDEITNQLDPQTEEEVINSLMKVADQKKTILMITHHPELLKKFNSVYEMADGVLSKTERPVLEIKHPHET